MDEADEKLDIFKREIKEPGWFSGQLRQANYSREYILAAYLKSIGLTVGYSESFSDMSLLAYTNGNELTVFKWAPLLFNELSRPDQREGFIASLDSIERWAKKINKASKLTGMTKLVMEFDEGDYEYYHPRKKREAQNKIESFNVERWTQGDYALLLAPETWSKQLIDSLFTIYDNIYEGGHTIGMNKVDNLDINHNLNVPRLDEEPFNWSASWFDDAAETSKSLF